MRSVQSVIQGYATSDGAGVKLVRVLDPRQAKQLDPFLLFDEFRSDEAREVSLESVDEFSFRGDPSLIKALIHVGFLLPCEVRAIDRNLNRRRF